MFFVEAIEAEMFVALNTFCVNLFNFLGSLSTS